MAAKDCFLLKGGRVIDPANEVDKEPLDVLLQGRKVAEIGENLQLPLGSQVFDATNSIVCPGLIDMHVHCFPGGTLLGVDPDKWSLKRGVTTVVDAGSAGAANFDAFLSYAKTRKTRIFFFLHASRIGLKHAGCASDKGVHGELEVLEDINQQQCLDCVVKHLDQIVGIKIRLAAQVSNGGENEHEAYRRALTIAHECDLPLMVHHAMSTIPIHSVDPSGLCLFRGMRRGDIRTHMFHGFESGIVDMTTSPPCILPSVMASRERGVLHDIGHGQGSFSWTVAEICATQAFWPDTISTDHHSGNVNGPAYDLPMIMSKLLHLGMPLYDVIKAVTATPALAISKQHKIGSLSPGRCADVTVLRWKECDVLLEDCHVQMRKISKRLEPIAVWKSGERITIEEPWPVWPNKSEQYLQEQQRINAWKK